MAETHEEAEWRLAYVMPNLELAKSFEFGGIAFVPNDDERLTDIRQRNRAARTLLDNFQDTGGGRISPSAVIYQVPSRFNNLWSAIGDARNCLALATVLNGWKISIGELNNFLVRDSDHFDFYGRWPSDDGQHLQYDGPALGLITGVPRRFIGQPHSYILPARGALA